MLAHEQQGQQPPPMAERALAGFYAHQQPQPAAPEGYNPGGLGPAFIQNDTPQGSYGSAPGAMHVGPREAHLREERALAHQWLEQAGYQTTGDSMQNYLEARRLEQAFQAQLGGHIDAIRGSGVMGIEGLVAEASLGGQEAFGQMGDYSGTLTQEAHDAVRRDVHEASELTGVDPSLFEQVGESSGVPIVRARYEELEPTEGGRRQIQIGDDIFTATTLEEYQESGHSEKKVTLPTKRAAEATDHLPTDPDLGRPDFITDEHGAYPARYESIYRRRARAILGGQEKKEAIKQVGSVPEKLNEITGALISPAMEVASFGLAETRERDRRGMEYLSGGSVEATATASHLAGFIAGPLKGLGALKGATAKGLTRIANRSGREIVAEVTDDILSQATKGLKKGTPAYARAASRAQAQAGSIAHAAGQQMLRTKLLNYFGPKMTAIGAGVIYEATKPNSPMEQDFVGDIELQLRREGVPAVEARAQAESHLRMSKAKGAAFAFGLMEFTGGPLGKVSTEVTGKLLRGTRLEGMHAQIASSMTGAGQGFVLAGADPTTRQAMQDWVESGFKDEESWKTVRDGVLISAGVFGLHGFLSTQVAVHKQMRERYEEIGRIIPSSKIKEIEAAEKSLRKRLQGLELERASKAGQLSTELHSMGWRAKAREGRMELAVRDYENLKSELTLDQVETGAADKSRRRIATHHAVGARDLENQSADKFRQRTAEESREDRAERSARQAEMSLGIPRGMVFPRRAEPMALDLVAARWGVERGALRDAIRMELDIRGDEAMGSFQSSLGSLHRAPNRERNSRLMEGISMAEIASQEAQLDRLVATRRREFVDALDRVIEEGINNPRENDIEPAVRELEPGKLRDYAERHEIEPSAEKVFDHLTREGIPANRVSEAISGLVRDGTKAEVAEAAKIAWDIPKSWPKDRIIREVESRAETFVEASKYLEKDAKKLRVAELDVMAARLALPRLVGTKERRAEQLRSGLDSIRARQAFELIETQSPRRLSPEHFSGVAMGEMAQKTESEGQRRAFIAEQVALLAPGDRLQVGSRGVEVVDVSGKTQVRVRDESGKETMLAESELLSGEVTLPGEPSFSSMPRSEVVRGERGHEHVDPMATTDTLYAEASRLRDVAKRHDGSDGVDSLNASSRAQSMADMVQREIESRQVVESDGPQYRDRWLRFEEEGQIEAQLSGLKSGNEVVGVIGRDADTGAMTIRQIKEGEPGRVELTAREVREKAEGLAEVLGVFHTHPKGESISSADSAAAAKLRAELGVRTYAYDGKNLLDVAPADTARGVVSTTRERPGVPTAHERGLQRALEAEKDPARRAEIEHQIEVAKSDRELVEAIDRVGDRESPHARRMDAEQNAVADHQESIALEAGARAPFFGKLLNHVLRPDPSVKREAYRRKTLGDPKKGLFRLFRTPQQFVPVEIYDQMRHRSSQMQARLDKMFRTLYGRGVLDQLRFGGKGAAGAPLAKFEEGSSTSHRLAAALDGMTVRDFNRVKDILKIEAPEGDLVESHLSSSERVLHDQMRNVMEDVRFRMGKHIWRHEAKRSEGRVKRAESALQNEGIGPDAKARAEMEIAEHSARLENIRMGRDPKTGEKWGLDRYLHRMWEDAVGPNSDARPVLLRQEISKEQWAAGVQHRAGREGYTLDLHRIMDTYIPAMEAKIQMDHILDKTNEVFYGQRDWASGLFDLAQPWHTQSRFLSEQMKLDWNSPEGWRSMAAIPRSEVRDRQGHLESIDVRGDLRGERVRVFKTKALARAAGMPEAPTFRDFRVLKGGLAQSLDPSSKDMRTLDYTKETVRRMFGEREEVKGMMKAVTKMVGALTKYQYHAYLGALYPKAAATNMIFGVNQLVAEVGPQAAWEGISMAGKILVQGRGRSTPSTRKYYRVLREGASHLESFVGYADEGSSGLGHPRTRTQRWAKNLNAASFGPFKGSEALVRAGSYLSGYRMGEKAGWSKAESHRFARDVMSHTQFDMGAYAAPSIVNHPLGYPLIMLRRYALNLLDRHMRGYKGLWKATAGKALAKQRLEALEGLVTGKAPGKVKAAMFLRGEEKKAPVTAEMLASQQAMLKERSSPEHFDNAAFAMRSALVSGMTVFLYRQLFGRDPREQVSSAIGELPLLDKLHGVYSTGFGNAIGHAPVPGLTGPFELAPVQAQAAAGFAEAMLKRMNGDEFAFADYWDEHKTAVIGRMARDISKVFAAQPIPGEEGKVGVYRGDELHYITTRSDLVGNIFLPGRTNEVKAAWDASNLSFAEQQMRKTRRQVWSRYLGSEDPKKIEQGIALGIEEGFLPDMGSLERKAMLKTTTTNVRRVIASSVDYQGRIMQAARQLPHMTKTEGLQLLFLLGLDDSDWWRLPDGTARVQGEVAKDLLNAIETWESKIK